MITTRQIYRTTYTAMTGQRLSSALDQKICEAICKAENVTMTPEEVREFFDVQRHGRFVETGDTLHFEWKGKRILSLDTLFHVKH